MHMDINDHETKTNKNLNRKSILGILVIAVWLMSAKPLHRCQEKCKPDLRKDVLEYHKICIIILWNWNERLFDAILRSYLLIPWHCRNEGNVWFWFTTGSISLNSDCYLVDNMIISSTNKPYCQYLYQFDICYGKYQYKEYSISHLYHTGSAF